MEDARLFEFIKDAIYCHTGIDLYDIDDLLEMLEVELTEEEKDEFEEQLLDIAESLGEDYEDQIAWDMVDQFKELLKDKLPKYPEDAPGQLHLF